MRFTTLRVCLYCFYCFIHVYCLWGWGKNIKRKSRVRFQFLLFFCLLVETAPFIFLQQRKISPPVPVAQYLGVVVTHQGTVGHILPSLPFREKYEQNSDSPPLLYLPLSSFYGFRWNEMRTPHILHGSLIPGSRSSGPPDECLFTFGGGFYCVEDSSSVVHLASIRSFQPHVVKWSHRNLCCAVVPPPLTFTPSIDLLHQIATSALGSAVHTTVVLCTPSFLCSVRCGPGNGCRTARLGGPHGAPVMYQGALSGNCCGYGDASQQRGVLQSEENEGCAACGGFSTTVFF